jgi:hypothetical protein
MDKAKEIKAARQAEAEPVPLTEAPENGNTDSLRGFAAESDMPVDTVPDRKPIQPPTSPIQSGRLITYRGADGRLCGGDLDRLHGTVAGSEYGTRGWTITLTDGQSLSLSAIQGVTRLSSDGKVVEAWTVRRHGLDGEGQ